MGVTWSESRKLNVKGKNVIVKSGAFPDNKDSSNKLWNLWKAAKTELKQDGFSISKYKSEWQISYWHTITPDSEIITEGGDKSWLAEFKKKVEKWKAKLNKYEANIADIEETVSETSILNSLNNMVFTNESSYDD